MHGSGGDSAWAALIQYDKPLRLEAVCVSAHDHYTRAEAYQCAREEIARRREGSVPLTGYEAGLKQPEENL
jgi:hypothetical protein